VVAPPDIALTQSGANLGAVPNGEVRQVTSEVRNEGERPLTIEAVTTSCGCTSASVEPTVIPAGGYGTLTINYDSGAHGPEFRGPVERQVFIASDDPDEREVVFSIQVNVIDP
jgi:hypothetical protein